MCIPSLNILDLKVHEKTPTQILNVNMLHRERKKKWMKNRKIRAMILSLNPTIHLPILHMYTVWERTVHVSRCPALYSGRTFVPLCLELIIFVF